MLLPGSFLRPLLALAVLGLLAGCAQIPHRPEPPPLPPAVLRGLGQAGRLESTGDLAGAAQLYDRLSTQVPPERRNELLLRAAETWLRVPDLDAAEGVLDRVGRQGLGPEEAWRLRLVEAQLLLGRSRPAEALDLLGTEPPPSAPRALLVRWLRERAQAARQTGDLPEAARMLSRLDALLVNPGERLDNQLLLVRTLGALEGPAVAELRGSAQGALGGWLDLAQLLTSPAARGSGLDLGLAQWRASHPGHPALPELVPEYLAELRREQAPPDRVAVLLPLSGRLAPVAAAVSAGILAAYYGAPAQRRSDLRFYDVSDSTQVWPQLQRALADRAQAVIGPLQKAAVQQLAQAGQLPVPVLALNRVSSDVPPPAQLYQFGLAPEDEARQAAEQAWTDGATEALALVPEGDWGRRLLQAFRERWETLGGRLVDYQTYDPSQHDFTAPIRRLLGATDAPRGSPSVQPRNHGQGGAGQTRGDSRALFLAAAAAVVRQLWPQLQFHRLGGVPVYTTSYISAAPFKLPEDLDLVGLRYPDIPWLLRPDDRAPVTLDGLPQGLLPGYPMARLFALGMDSLRLLPALLRLKELPGSSFPGATGDLSLEAPNQIYRRLVWARMTAQGPRPLGAPDGVAASAAGGGAASPEEQAATPTGVEPLIPPGGEALGSPAAGAPPAAAAPGASGHGMP
jgi:uncharacterized protein